MARNNNQTVEQEASDVHGIAWNVLIRHSSLYVKQATITAQTKEEAKRIFLDLAQKKHEEIAQRQRGPNALKDAAKVREAYQRAIEAENEGRLRDSWVIRPQAEADAEVEAIKTARTKKWDAPPTVMVAQVQNAAQ